QGLNLFDRTSQSFSRIPLHHGDVQIKNVRITSLYEDENENLYVGTNGRGLFQCALMNDGQIIFKPIVFPGISRNEVSSLSSDHAGNIWIGFQEEGLIRWNVRRDEHIRIRSNPLLTSSLSNDRVSALLFDKFGTLWVGTLNGINRVNLANVKFKFYQ